ncbi:Mrp/NBP35 family ATP-binding protein [Leucobacter chromiiresistens]|uniref:Iron-sulfur cluster carrier protein n=1 Tax=Leucobacter chromiiresistens TaxID=1079994 RepID=A0A1H1AEP2_9MICO|nr:P-loop NTPase [Leucobacter chromiiresistens]SDQ38061.1 ATP-binding protein involved in chromosome partitioning [Leucobacter chromiiresistens]
MTERSDSGAEGAVWRALDGVSDPEILRPITELGMVRGVAVDAAGRAEVSILLTIAGCPAARRIEADVRAAAASAPGVTGVAVDVGVMTPAERQSFIERVRGDRGARPQQFGPDSLTRVIAVTSGKGGVGKSSLTTGLAVALAEQGLSVGLIDADVFGFSIPGLLGLSRDGRTVQPTRVDDMILPPVAHGVKVVSIGMFLGDADPRSTAVSWRGPMLHRTIEQFLRDVWFGDLDVLLLDLPPGTGDIAISIGQLLPQAEVLVVTTPQEAAADVAVRSALVARQTGQRVIGVVENMAGLTQPDGSVLDLFGSGGGELVAERLSDAEHGAVPLLGSVPLSPAFRAGGDAGVPTVLADPADPSAAEVIRIAAALTRGGRGLAGRPLGIRVREG